MRARARQTWAQIMQEPRTPDTVEATLDQAFRSFLQSQQHRKNDAICLAFHAMGAEFNVLKPLKEEGWSVALPLVLPGFRLSFHLYLKAGKEVLSLEKGAFGIMEPGAGSPILEPRKDDILLVPTLAANARGFRLGKGGGFYDRLMDISPYHQMEKWAIVPENLMDAGFVEEPHDLRLNKIITEERIATYP